MNSTRTPVSDPKVAGGQSTGARPESGWIHTLGLTRSFGSRTALHPTDLSIGPGQVTGLLGPNGSGKSTLMRTMVGLVRPDAGQATVDGITLVGDGTEVRKQVTYAPGEMHLYGEMHGRAHLDWLLRGRKRAAHKRALELAVDAMQLPLDERVRGYSHGMKRQLLFAAAMGPDVRIRILDEPTEGLDPTRRGAVLDLLAEDVSLGRTILLSSHHL
ncbi:MAG: ABC-2 type transport system ATP-binding protein, partial [Planctomycetota bacterium]